MWDEVIGFIGSHGRFAIATHEHPDGDAVGAEIGLGLFLEQIGKSVLMVNDDPIPRIYRFLDPESRVRCYEPARDDPDIAACDAAFVVDVGALDRVGKVGQTLRRLGIPMACIDHHVTNDGFAQVNAVEPHASSAAALVLHLTTSMGKKPGPAAADALFCGLSTDTGWFRFPNATPRAFRDAARLVAAGARPARLYELIYEDLSWPRTRLLARALATLQSDADGRIAYVALTRQVFAETGAVDQEVEGFVDKLREIGGVEVIILFREQAEGGTRVSLRAKHDADVGSLAASFGGGGHRRAAGITLAEPLDAVVPRVLAAARELVGK